MRGIVINAIYPEKESYANHYFGPEYFCARDEFSLVEPLKVRNTISRVLLTFGGVDPNNLTYKVLDAIYESCLKVNIQMDVVLGMGYKDLSSIEKFEKANIVRDAKNISEYMKDADIAFTSAGRDKVRILSIKLTPESHGARFSSAVISSSCLLCSNSLN